MNTVRTPKGTVLPLVQLKGKDYLQVAHRLIWFNEETTDFYITTDFPVLTEDMTVARAVVEIIKDGKVIRRAVGTKRESKKDFFDHTEKAETGALGRALAMLGFGTQFAIADLDEGDRIVDSPVVNTAAAKTEPMSEERAKMVEQTTETVEELNKPKRSYRKPKTNNSQKESEAVEGWE